MDLRCSQDSSLSFNFFAATALSSSDTSTTASIFYQYLRSKVYELSLAKPPATATRMRLYYHNHSGGGSIVGVFVLLLPILFSTLFAPLSLASPSIFSEFNAPKPRHLRLLESAILRQTSNEQQSDLWMPLSNQGWKPCVELATSPCAGILAVASTIVSAFLLVIVAEWGDKSFFCTIGKASCEQI